jgi:ABC-type dipeptide/oligopeptide/nickel transport system permease subunit
MISFAFGLLTGYLMGVFVGYYVAKIDRDIKNGRG